MEENQVVQDESGTNFPTKWILLIVGVGCALLACAALVIGLSVALFLPVTGNVFSEINEELDIPQPAIEETTPITSIDLGEILIPDHTVYPLVDDNKMGDPDAPVKIVLYSDFLCVYCMHHWDETEPEIIERYVETGKVYYEYRSFGDFLGPQSATAAEAAYCASDQEKFWEYHDILFLNWTGEGTGDFSLNRLKGYADAIDLDVKAFSDCLAEGNYKSWLDRDVTNANADGVRATPTFIINGKLIEGAQPFSVFQIEIEAALNE